MSASIFWVVLIFALISAAVALLPLSRGNSAQNRCRKLLFCGASLALLPIVLKMFFSFFPLLEARLMPVEPYAAVQREFWLPFTVLFFAIASHLVSTRSRRAVLMIVALLAAVVIQQTFWHLGEPEIYNHQGTVVNGVYRQTSFETCGAAAMATLLNAIGIKTSEGEMARLSMTAPRGGVSPHLAAYGIKRKLRRLKRPEQVAVLVPRLRDLQRLATPYLAGVKFSFTTNHMVCVLETQGEYLIVGDPISSGPKKWSWNRFEKMWSGIIVTCH